MLVSCSLFLISFFVVVAVVRLIEVGRFSIRLLLFSFGLFKIFGYKARLGMKRIRKQHDKKNRKKIAQNVYEKLYKF